MSPRFQPALGNAVAIHYVELMKHEADIVPNGEPENADDPMSDAALGAFLAALPPCPGLPSTPGEIAASDARALADIAAGRVHSHAVVAEWLKTWGYPGRKPFRKWLAERDG